LLILIGAWYVGDIDKRYNINFRCPNPEDIRIFNQDTTSDARLLYQTYFGQKRFRFPRDSVAEMAVVKNIPFVSGLTKRQLSSASQKALIQFLNNPDNFTWENNVMLYSQSDYMVYCYDKRQQLIGKLWLCRACASLKTKPFTPNIKFGRLKKDLLPVLLKILQIER